MKSLSPTSPKLVMTKAADLPEHFPVDQIISSGRIPRLSTRSGPRHIRSIGHCYMGVCRKGGLVIVLKGSGYLTNAVGRMKTEAYGHYNIFLMAI